MNLLFILISSFEKEIAMRRENTKLSALVDTGLKLGL